MRPPLLVATDRAAAGPSAAPARAAASAAVRAAARSTAAPPTRPSNTTAPPAASTTRAISGTADPRSPLRTSALLPDRSHERGKRRFLLGLFDLEHRGRGGHLLALVEIHHPDAGGVAPLRRDVAGRGSDGDAAGRDQEELVVE